MVIIKSLVCTELGNLIVMHITKHFRYDCLTLEHWKRLNGNIPKYIWIHVKGSFFKMDGYGL